MFYMLGDRMECMRRITLLTAVCAVIALTCGELHAMHTQKRERRVAGFAREVTGAGAVQLLRVDDDGHLFSSERLVEPIAFDVSGGGDAEPLIPLRHNGRYFLRTSHKPLQFYWEHLPVSCTLLRNKLWRRASGAYRVPEERLDAWLQREESLERSLQSVVTWIGHSSFLIQVGGINIVTDPVFGDLSAWYPRLLPPGIHIEQLPPIDLVLLSHNHRDHMDEASLRALLARNPRMKALVPEGNKEWFDRAGSIHAVEHTWWADTVAGGNDQAESVTCTFVPADHWSQRGLRDHNASLWGGWVIRHEDQIIYFAGDTAYDEQIFDEVAQRFPSITAALMPISPCSPVALRRNHMSARQSVAAFARLGACRFVPAHWGTFAMGTDEFEAPIRELERSWQQRRAELGDRQLCVVKAGQRLALE